MEATTPKKTDQTPPPSAPNVPPQQNQRRNSTGGIGETKSSLSSSAQMITVEQKVQRSWFNPARLVRGNEYTVSKQVPAPAPKKEESSTSSSTSNSAPVVEKKQTTPPAEEKKEEVKKEEVQKPVEAPRGYVQAAKEELFGFAYWLGQPGFWVLENGKRIFKKSDQTPPPAKQ